MPQPQRANNKQGRVKGHPLGASVQRHAKQTWVPPCYFFLHGRCTKLDCKFDHYPELTPARFATPALMSSKAAPAPSSSYGDSFPSDDSYEGNSHKSDESYKFSEVSENNSNESDRRPVCQFLLKGTRCTQGASCPLSHDLKSVRFPHGNESVVIGEQESEGSSLEQDKCTSEGEGEPITTKFSRAANDTVDEDEDAWTDESGSVTSSAYATASTSRDETVCKDGQEVDVKVKQPESIASQDQDKSVETSLEDPQIKKDKASQVKDEDKPAEVKTARRPQPTPCHFYFKGRCLNGDTCAFAHTQDALLNKNKDGEATAPITVSDGEEAKRAQFDAAMARGRPPCSSCGIQPREYALMTCSHCYCMGCITTWRQLNASTTSVDRVARGYCPHCGPAASYVIASTHFYPPGPQKDAFFASFHQHTKQIPCKHLRGPDMWCPFGKMCLYSHKNPWTGVEIPFTHTLNDTINIQKQNGNFKSIKRSYSNNKLRQSFRREVPPPALNPPTMSRPDSFLSASASAPPIVSSSIGPFAFPTARFPLAPLAPSLPPALLPPVDRSAIHPSVAVLLWPSEEDEENKEAPCPAPSLLTKSASPTSMAQSAGPSSMVQPSDPSTLAESAGPLAPSTNGTRRNRTKKMKGKNVAITLSKSMPASKTPSAS